jgi:hypothetical protein
MGIRPPYDTEQYKFFTVPETELNDPGMLHDLN